MVATQVYRIGTSYFNKPLSAAGAVILAGAAVILVIVNVRIGGRSATRRIGMI